ncbi:MAG: 23S rRNA (adenine(2503)-C(2))-methyltransferase RlmN [Candidatus Uhrbacteria bacterium]
MSNLPKTRNEMFVELCPNQPAFRLQQIEQALFDPQIDSWLKVSTLNQEQRQQLVEQHPWISVQAISTQESQTKDSHKALLELVDGLRIETVLMANKRGGWTICVSSQVGCAMQCQFCATGRLGLKRNLNLDEIVDQYRFWQNYLNQRSGLSSTINNLVVMGMGEPLLNYENIRDALRVLIRSAELGATRIVVSTVGNLPGLERLLDDPDWPAVRLAISLHSADPELRKKLMPSSVPDFHKLLADWSRRYLQKHGNRRHHLTFEYLMLDGLNDSLDAAKLLAKYVNKIGRVKVNLISYNITGETMDASSVERIESFADELRSHGIDVTRRRSLGSDISAACGQLAGK